MRLLVTGADGFVGRWLVRAARTEGHQVVAAVIPDAPLPTEWLRNGALAPVEVIRADFRREGDVAQLADARPEAVVHLAAVASGAAARVDPQGAMQVNATGSRWLVEALVRSGLRPLLLFTSTAEVYGAGHEGPIPETAPVKPVSPYATSKAAAEEFLVELGGQHGIAVLIARAFPHSGPGQGTAFVLPALTERLKEAARTGASQVRTGNLAAVRDFLDVRDVVRAYLLLLEHGTPGGTYNVASGTGHRISDCFTELARRIGVRAQAVEDAALLRPGDIPVLIGDATQLRATTGWSPQIPFERMLQDLVDAQAD